MNCSDILQSVFNAPFTGQYEDLVNQEKPCFAYYTTADTAYNIISNQEIWMRNASLMNDYSEIKYGLNLIAKSFGRNSTFCQKLNEVGKRLNTDLFSDFAKSFDDWVHDLETKTFLTCISKHSTQENDLGRLSMWRAYGGRNGVAIIMDASPMLKEEDKLNVYSVPVQYWSEEETDTNFAKMVQSIQECFDSMAIEDWAEFKSDLSHFLKIYAIALKHPGFAEEQEWRVFYRPSEEISDFVNSEIETIDGVPQKVHKLSLIDDAEIAIKTLIMRIIIGPCEHQYEISNTLIDALESQGVERPWDIMKISSIPLRN